MASIERTAYPRFKSVISAQELGTVFTPSAEEAAWASEKARWPSHRLGLMLRLKGFQRLVTFRDWT